MCADANEFLLTTDAADAVLLCMEEPQCLADAAEHMGSGVFQAGKIIVVLFTDAVRTPLRGLQREQRLIANDADKPKHRQI